MYVDNSHYHWVGPPYTNPSRSALTKPNTPEQIQRRFTAVSVPAISRASYSGLACLVTENPIMDGMLASRRLAIPVAWNLVLVCNFPDPMSCQGERLTNQSHATLERIRAAPTLAGRLNELLCTMRRSLSFPIWEVCFVQGTTSDAQSKHRSESILCRKIIACETKISWEFRTYEYGGKIMSRSFTRKTRARR
jgi:hypothetical protein